jgi:uncharacterized membrane protein (UPF0127 family)
MNYPRRVILWVGIIIVFALFVWLFLPTIAADRDSIKRTTIQIGNLPLTALVVDTPELRQKGLGGTRSLLPGTGMLFIFEEPGRHMFWMKDMNFDLDIVWIDQRLKVVGIEKDVSKDSYPKAFTPPSSILYVLEVPAGFSDSHHIKVGDRLSVNLLDS